SFLDRTEPMSSRTDSDLVPTGWGLLDAESQHEAFPDTFPIPSLAEPQALRTGDLVKLVFVLDPPPTEGPNAERMWIEVRRIHEDGTFDGWLTNDPVVISDLEPEALIAFEPCHVAGIALRSEEVAFDVDARAVVSRRALDLDGAPGWAGFDEPVNESDSGWTVTAGDEPEGFFDEDPAAVTTVLAIGQLVQRYPALVEVFQAGEGEWVYRPDHRRYVRLKGT